MSKLGKIEKVDSKMNRNRLRCYFRRIALKFKKCKKCPGYYECELDLFPKKYFP